MSQTKVNYLSRDFNTLRADLISWAKQQHGDKFQYFNDASTDMMYLEMVAFVGDMLSYYTDKTFNESFLTTAQAAESLVRIAKDLGFFSIGYTPAQTQVTLTIKVPFKIEAGVSIPDPDFLLSIKPGMLLTSDSGVSFEVLEGVNFNDEFNRTVVPNLDANKAIIDYTITKTAVAKAGETKIQRFYVTNALAKPFLNVTLDDKEVTEIIGVVDVPGNQFIAPVDEDFTDPDKSWFEVQALAQETKFIELSQTQQSTQAIASYISPVVKLGVDVPISKRFIARRDVNDLLTLTFGSSSTSFTDFNNLIQTSVDPTSISYNQVLNNTSLGEIPPPNSTLFIKYRVKGGDKTNVVAGQINTIVAKTFYPSDALDLTTLQQVRSSLTVTNNIPAMGGKDAPGREEIRMTAGKIFSAQDRAVTYEDVKTILETMPAAFGKAFRIAYEEMKPRVSNFQQVENGVNTLLTELMTETTTVGRQIKAQEITSFLANLRTGTASINNVGVPSTLDATSLQLLGTTPSLWIGEKARLYVLGLDADGKASSAFKDSNGVWLSPNEMLKANIKEFLLNKRVIGDWIDVVDARIVNVQIDFTILADKKNKQAVLIDCLNKLKAYFDINNWSIGQPIYLANIQTVLQEINGVINVVDLKIYNIFGLGNDSKDPISGKIYAPFETGRYRNNTSTSASVANNKFLMKSVNNVILGYNDTIFEVRFPESDLIGRCL